LLNRRPLEESLAHRCREIQQFGDLVTDRLTGLIRRSQAALDSDLALLQLLILGREDGVWKFKSRQAFNDVTAPTAAPAGGGGQSQGAPSAPPAGGR
jgi:hypothetical protein